MDNLLEQEPGNAGVHPDAIISDVMVEGEGEVPALHDSHDTSASDGDISGVESDASEEDEEDLEVDDNFNSAGEEVGLRSFSKLGGLLLPHKTLHMLPYACTVSGCAPIVQLKAFASEYTL